MPNFGNFLVQYYVTQWQTQNVWGAAAKKKKKRKRHHIHAGEHQYADSLDIFTEGTSPPEWKGHPRGHFITFCPLEGHPRGRLIMFYLSGASTTAPFLRFLNTGGLGGITALKLSFTSSLLLTVTCLPVLLWHNQEEIKPKKKEKKEKTKFVVLSHQFWQLMDALQCNQVDMFNLRRNSLDFTRNAKNVYLNV